MRRTFIIISFLLLLSSCQHNPYASAYKATLVPDRAVSALPFSGATQIVPVALGDLVAETKSYERGGYVVVGQAIFLAESGDYSAALRAQAQAVGADVVLSGFASAETKDVVVAMDSVNPVNGSLSTSGGYVTQYGGRFATNAQTSPSMMSNPEPSTVSATVEETNYAAVFLKKRAAPLPPAH